jgi:hypothetical protein
MGRIELSGKLRPVYMGPGRPPDMGIAASGNFPAGYGTPGHGLKDVREVVSGHLGSNLASLRKSVYQKYFQGRL